MKVSEYIFSSDIFLGSRIAGGTGAGGATESSLWFTDGHVCMHGTHSLDGHSCGLELLRLLIFLMGLKVYKRTLGNPKFTGTGT